MKSSSQKRPGPIVKSKFSTVLVTNRGFVTNRGCDKSEDALYLNLKIWISKNLSI